MDEIERAKRHISNIRSSKHADIRNSPSIVEDLQNYLDLISDELYRKPTHFLLELVQNADDNQYDTEVVPTLKISLGKSHIQFSCNEKGFSSENVDAICSIGRSTKKDRTKGSIVENGIGFKSVFRIADVVWISSGPYSFKLDREEPLGMITPIWTTYPKKTTPGYTQLYLDSISEKEILRNELEDFDATVLLFLRRLKTIEIGFPGTKRIFELRKDINHPSRFKIILKTASERPKRNTRNFVVTKRTIGDLPKEDKREGVRQTKLVLAFPLGRDGSPFISNQMAYASLPIRQYDLKFLIQADFILTAGREDIVHGSLWNEKLEEGLAETFSKAVTAFNHSEHLRYTWPLFLPEESNSCSEFSTLKNGILSSLRDQPILYSDADSLEPPESLVFIPTEFRDSNGVPFVEEACNKSDHLNSYYDATSEYLFLLGVQRMDFASFLDQLTALVARSIEFMRGKAPSWHSDLAYILYGESSEKKRISQLPLIPLRDGSWARASDGQFHFDTADTTPVPKGLNIRLVEAKAAKDKNRMRLFKWLGVAPCNIAKFRKLIRLLHEGMQVPQPNTVDRTILVSHAAYLFETSSTTVSTIESFESLWLVDTSNQWRRGRQLYIDVPGQDLPMSEYSRNSSSGVHMIHKDYLTIFNGEKKTNWINWLIKSLQVSAIPRLSDRDGVTTEFVFLVQSETMDLLHILKGNWEHYSPCFSSGVLQNSLCQSISKAEVLCQNGSKHKLNKTLLPVDTLKNKAPNLPYVDLKDPHDDGWLNFGIFGLITEANWEFNIRRLKSFQGARSSSDMLPEIKGIYEQLQTQCEADEHLIQLVKSSFQSAPLIYIADRKRWVSLGNCVWGSNTPLRKHHELRERYPTCGDFFNCHLGIGGLTACHVIDELYSISPALEDRQFMKDLLFTLNEYLSADTDRLLDDSLEKLLKSNIFPIRRPEAVGEVTYDCVNSTEWFIPDKQSLYESFEGQLPFADFTCEEIRRLTALWKSLGIQKLFISNVVKEEPYYEDEIPPVFDVEFTKRFQQKASYLSKFGSTPLFYSPLSRVRLRLEHLQVFGASNILIRRWVSWKQKIIYGSREDQGRVFFQDMDGDLAIYLSFSDLHNKSFPVDLLSEKLIDYCGITDSDQKRILGYIVSVKEETAELELAETRRIIEQYTANGMLGKRGCSIARGGFFDG